MDARPWYAIVAVATLLAIPLPGAAQTQVGLVNNWDCEQATPAHPGAPATFVDSLAQIPGWTNYDSLGSPSARIDGLGAGQTAACVIVGPGALHSLAFTVTGGDLVSEFSADVWEMVDDSCPALPCRADSVVVLQFSAAHDTDGDDVLDSYQWLGEFTLYCDDYADAHDNGRIDGSDACTAADTHVHIVAKDEGRDFECLDSVTSSGAVRNSRCTRYDGAICNAIDPVKLDPDCMGSANVGGCSCVAAFPHTLVVPPGATEGRVTLGGALSSGPVPAPAGAAPAHVSITSFDNVVYA